MCSLRRRCGRRPIGFPVPSTQPFLLESTLALVNWSQAVRALLVGPRGKGLAHLTIVLLDQKQA